jgi:hypothetical protein
VSPTRLVPRSSSTIQQVKLSVRAFSSLRLRVRTSGLVSPAALERPQVSDGSPFTTREIPSLTYSVVDQCCDATFRLRQPYWALRAEQEFGAEPSSPMSRGYAAWTLAK